MKNIFKITALAAALFVAGQASAASVSADVPVTLEVVPSCVWRSAVNDPSLLTTPSTTSAILTQFSVAATCNAFTSYSITADAQFQVVSKAGESVRISLHSDPGRATYLRDVPINGTAGPLFDANQSNVSEVVYLKVTGQGVGGSFVSGGVRACKNFCVNGHLAGDCRAPRSDDGRSKESSTQGVAE